ncbi:MAG: hypothetical protein M1820_000322 [Bogoriella megaspora]|nr:MAG: hypothetical protein M1820_000322 [Bogoriella megaspora]
MVLSVLTDSDVRRILHSLDRDDIFEIQQSLADGLHYYSTATEDNGCCSSYQPMRTQLKRKDGGTTLFMPASSTDGLGVKIVTLQTPDSEPSSAKSEFNPNIERLSISSKSETASTRNSSLSGSVLDAPPPSVASSQSTTPRGSLTLLDKDGTPRALINAEELTAFRTALASCMIFKKRNTVHDITVFGAGKQAYWHIRLAIILRPDDVHHVNVVNRDFERAGSMIKSLYHPFGDDESTTGIVSLPHKAKFSILTNTHHEYGRLVKEHVRKASVLFLTTPSLEPLFPAEFLTSTEGRRKGRYIAAIGMYGVEPEGIFVDYGLTHVSKGSYKPHMVELHPEVLKQAVAPHEGHRHFHKHAPTGGAVLVDSVEACLKEAGEVIQAGLKPEEVVELGELVMLKRDAERRRAELGEHPKGKDGMEIKADGGLYEWLSKGNVIYKSVGLGLMDVVTGREVVRMADERGIGTRILGF